MLSLRNTWYHIRRSPYQALAAISVMALTSFVTLIFILAGLGSSAILSYFEKKPQITAFFADTKTEEEIASLKERLMTTGKVASLKYVSKEEALKIYQEQNKEDPLLLEMVTADILPASLEVAATDAKFLGDLAQILKNEKGVEEVIYQKDIVESLIFWTSTVRRIGGGLVLFLSVISLLIILTVIGMKIALKKEEIEILKLIGASNWYIRSPFLLEGAFYGIIGAFLSWVISYFLVIYVNSNLAFLFKGIPALNFASITQIKELNFIYVWPISTTFMIILLFINLVFAAFLGIFGSFIAVHRYLRN